MSEHISIGMWNIQGLISNDICKLDIPEVKGLLNNFDIVNLVETHIGKDTEIQLEGYSIIASQSRPKYNRAKKHSGGIMTFAV